MYASLILVPGTSINIEAGRMKLFALTAQYLAVSFKVKECIYDVVHYFYLFRIHM